jgi:hypothetical protein
MHILLAVSVTTILTATTPQAPPALAPSAPVTLTFRDTTLDEAISMLARYSGVTIEIDQSVSPDVMRQPIAAGGRMMFREVTLEEAIAQLTRVNGLSYAVIGEKAVRIFKKP